MVQHSFLYLSPLLLDLTAYLSYASFSQELRGGKRILLFTRAGSRFTIKNLQTPFSNTDFFTMFKLIMRFYSSNMESP